MYVTGNGGVPGHRLWREVIIAVRSVQEGLPALTVDKVCLENEPRSWAGHGIQGTPSRRCAIVHIKTYPGMPSKGEVIHMHHVGRSSVINIFLASDFTCSDFHR